MIEENLLLIYYFLAAIVILSASFTVMYFISNPLDQSISTVNYPYAIGVKPTTISESGSVVITLSKLESSPKNERDAAAFTLYVVDSVGNGVSSDVGVINKVQTKNFPEDFNPNIKLEKGRYSVFLVPNSGNQSNTMSPLHFDVVYSPFISSFNTFAFTLGLPVTIALIISIITTLYEFASTKHSEANLKLQGALELDSRKI